jgi:hypothetical protein
MNFQFLADLLVQIGLFLIGLAGESALSDLISFITGLL